MDAPIPVKSDGRTKSRMETTVIALRRFTAAGPQQQQ